MSCFWLPLKRVFTVSLLLLSKVLILAPALPTGRECWERLLRAVWQHWLLSLGPRFATGPRRTFALTVDTLITCAI